MKSLKYIYSGLMVGGFMLFSTACSDDFLDQQPLGQASSATLFADETGAVRATNGIYAHLRNWDVVGFPYFGIEELPSDDADVGSTPGDGSFPRLELLNTFTYDPTVSELDGYWQGMYRGINRCNQVLDNVPDIEMDETLKARLLGEAKFLRAFYYFNLVRAFGAVPMIEHAFTDPETASEGVEKTAAAEIYNFIISDLTAAADVLPLKSEYGIDDLGRATKGAAQAMLAKVYLFMQDNQNAYNLAKTVIESGEYSLDPDYRAMFLPDMENGPESIFESQIIDRDDQTISNEYTKWQGVRGQFGWGFNSPSENLANAYEPGDPRREATIFFSGDTLEGADVPYYLDTLQGGMPRANKKTMIPLDIQPINYPGNSPTNRILLRYADLLLVYAEAANELGQSAEALMYVNMIRARARGANPGILPDITTTEQGALRDVIWHERRVELAMEGQRFFDVIRQNSVIPGRAKAVFDAAGKPAFNFDKHATFPIPQNQIDLGGGALVQDSSW